MQAPDFLLSDQNSQPRALKDYAGSWVVLYFYPKDDTPGCTAEACAIRDKWSGFTETGVVVLGVSADSPAMHQKFIAKYGLPFTLLSDPDKTAIKAYKAWGKKKLFGREYDGILRKTFLIDPTGNIAREYEQVTPADHASQLLQDLKELRKV